MNEQKVKEYFTQNDEWISKLGKEKLQKSFQVLENAILKYSYVFSQISQKKTPHQPLFLSSHYISHKNTQKQHKEQKD